MSENELQALANGVTEGSGKVRAPQVSTVELLEVWGANDFDFDKVDSHYLAKGRELDSRVRIKSYIKTTKEKTGENLLDTILRCVKDTEHEQSFTIALKKMNEDKRSEGGNKRSLDTKGVIAALGLKFVS